MKANEFVASLPGTLEGNLPHHLHLASCVGSLLSSFVARTMKDIFRHEESRGQPEVSTYSILRIMLICV